MVVDNTGLDLKFIEPLRGRGRHVRGAVHQGSKGKGKGGSNGRGGPSLLVVDGDVGFASIVSRKGEGLGLGVTVCWTIDDLKHLPFTHFDAAMIESEVWDGLQEPCYAELREQVLDHVPVIVHGGAAYAAAGGDRAAAASVALEAALKAAGKDSMLPH